MLIRLKKITETKAVVNFAAAQGTSSSTIASLFTSLFSRMSATLSRSEFCSNKQI